MKLSEQARLAPVATVVLREVDSGAVLVDTASGQCFELNRVGLEIWRAVGGGQTMREIYDVLVDRYPVDREQLMADVAHLTDALIGAGLVAVIAN